MSHAKASEEWGKKSVLEKAQAIDPENDRELLDEFVTFHNERHWAIISVELSAHQFLDWAAGTWIERRAEEIREERQAEYEPPEEQG